MKKNIVFLSLIILAIFACQKEINMDIPENERKLVVNGVFNIGEPIVLTVSKSKSMLEKSKIESVNNAEISLFANGAFFTKLDTITKLWSVEYNWDEYNYTTSNIYRTTYYSKDINIEADKLYKIEISAPGIDKMAYVEIKMPTRVPIIKIDTATVKTDQYIKSLQFDMHIKDPAGEENFYLINLLGKTPQRDPKDPFYSGNSTATLFIETDDVLINNGDITVENGLIFNDNLFNGKLQNIKFKTSEMWGDTLFYHVVLKSITEEYYNYLVSSSLFNANEGNPIAEPVSVKSNVKDGFGIVSAVNQWVDSSIIYIGPVYDYPGETF